MRLTKLRVQGFEAFADSGNVEFRDGINLIVGQNNSGKSSLLRALPRDLKDDRHRTPERWRTHEMPQPEVRLDIEISGAELKDAVLRCGAAWVPVPPQPAQPQQFVEGLWEKPEQLFAIKHMVGATFLSYSYPSHQIFKTVEGGDKQCVRVVNENGKLIVKEHLFNDGDDLPQRILEIWSRDMFYFEAERLTVGSCSAGRDERLRPDARNLAAVLHTLQTERGTLFARLIGHLGQIFPTVGNLSVPTAHGNSDYEILVWPTEEMTRRELAFPLNQSGTGVGQAVAILTAVMTIDNAIIVIDEINSFLHPAAVKAMLRIIQEEYGHHQYIISTHSPEVIGFAKPASIHQVTREGYESHVTRLDTESVRTFHELSENLGLSLSDVFAAKQVVWVEGPSEVNCFAWLFREKFEELPKGVVFSPVFATGDFARDRDRELVYKIYKRVSETAPGMGVRVTFSFDGEKLDEGQKAGMIRESRGKLAFLPRRHLECFLLDPEAIAELIVRQVPDLKGTVIAATVEQAIKAAASTIPFQIKEWSGNIYDGKWLAQVDAAKLIGKLCEDLSGHRAKFDKVSDGLFLLKSIYERNPAHLDELADHVRQIVDKVVAE